MEFKKGSCYCNNIRIKLKEEPKLIVNCHCNNCRSHTGSAFSSYIAFPLTSLEIISGKEDISEYTTEKGTKYFCKNCGTPIYNLIRSNPAGCLIYLGIIDDISDLTPRRNIWCESQLEWVKNISSIKSLEQGLGRK